MIHFPWFADKSYQFTYHRLSKKVSKKVRILDTGIQNRECDKKPLSVLQLPFLKEHIRDRPRQLTIAKLLIHLCGMGLVVLQALASCHGWIGEVKHSMSLLIYFHMSPRSKFMWTRIFVTEGHFGIKTRYERYPVCINMYQPLPTSN